MNHVLVTGGTGFLGARVCRELAARGDEVHVLARASSDKTALDGVDVRWHVGDLTDRSSVVAAVAATAERARKLAGRSAVVHSGALISYRTADTQLQRAVNVEGTRHVLDASRMARIARVLHVSSVVAVGHSADGRELTENAPYNNGDLGVDYTTTKHEAEELARAASAQLDVVIVNPGAIFGSVSRTSNSARFLRRVAQGRGPLVAPPGSLSVLGIEDAARGCLLALDRGKRGERYLLVESWMTSLELFRRIAHAFNRSGPITALPRAVWPAVMLAARAIDRVRPLKLAPPQALRMLACDMRFSGAKARQELGWVPKTFDAVLASTIDDLRARGLLDEAV